MKDILCKGDVKINKIKIGDIHYEFDFGCGVKTKVLSAPIEEDGVWSWSAEIIASNIGGTISPPKETKKLIEYAVNEAYPSHSVNLYGSDAYNMFGEGLFNSLFKK